MKKTELVAEITKKVGGGTFTAEVIDEFINIVVAKVAAGETVEINNFGKFIPYTTKATTGIDPQTGEIMEIPSKVLPKFRAFTKFKRAVAKSDAV